MAFKKRAIAAAAMGLVALASILLANAQQSPTLTVELASVDNTHYPNLSAVVNVLDNNGRPVPALNTDNFSATVDGQPAQLQGLQMVVDSQLSLAVVLVVDVSGSMAGEPLTAAQSSAAEFVKALSPQDTVAVLSFSDEVTTVQESTSDKAKATGSLQTLAAAGNTALFEATSQAVAKAVESKSPRPVIILLSDGVDYGGKSTVSRDDSIAQARAAGIPVYTIALGTEVDKAYLNELAQATGARLLETPSPEGLSQLYADIGALLRGQYVVSVQAPDLPAGASHTLELSVTAAGATAVASKTLSAAEPAVLTIEGLTTGSEVKSAATLTALVTGAMPSQVQFLVDGTVIATVTAPPYQVTLDPKTLQTGAHTLRVEAKDDAGAVTSSEVAFAVPVLTTHSNKTRAYAGLLSIAAALGIVYLFSRRRTRLRRGDVKVRLRSLSNGSSAPLEPEEDQPLPLTPGPVEQPDGKLIVVAGPNAGREYEVGVTPTSIGSAGWCEISFEGHDDVVGPEEARVWVHQGKLVFHKLTRLSLLGSGQGIGGWLILENGDEVDVGPFRLRFVCLSDEDKSQNVVSRPQLEVPVPSVHSAANVWSTEPAARALPADGPLAEVSGNIAGLPTAPTDREPESGVIEPFASPAIQHTERQPSVVELPAASVADGPRPDVFEPFAPPAVQPVEPPPDLFEPLASPTVQAAEVVKDVIEPPAGPATSAGVAQNSVEPFEPLGAQSVEASPYVIELPAAPVVQPVEPQRDVAEPFVRPAVQPAEPQSNVIDFYAGSPVQPVNVSQNPPDPFAYAEAQPSEPPPNVIEFPAPPVVQSREVDRTTIDHFTRPAVQPTQPERTDVAPTQRSLLDDDDLSPEMEDEAPEIPPRLLWTVDSPPSELPDKHPPQEARPLDDDSSPSSAASA